MVYMNMLKVYADCSNCIILKDSFGKSSAIPGKQNLFRVERIISNLSQLSNLFNGFRCVVLQSAATNDYLSKQYLRDIIDFVINGVNPRCESDRRKLRN